MPCWYYEKEDLETTPSIKDGIDPGTEARYRREGSRFIIEAGTTQGLRYDTMATGVVYFHRFYMFHSFKEFPRYIMGAACLFLAGKVEETPKKCKDIIKIAKNILSEQHFAAFGDDPKEEIMTHERILLQTIKFDLQVEHPYSYLLKYAKTFKGDKDKIQKLVQMAWTFVNDSLCTTLCLQWEPNIVAVGFLYLAGRLSKSDLMDWSGKSTKIKWWEQLTEDISLDIMEEICHKLLDLYAAGQHKGPPGTPGTPTKAPPKRPKPKTSQDGGHGDPKAKMMKQEHGREKQRPPPPPPPSGVTLAPTHTPPAIATHDRRQASPAPPPPPRVHSSGYPSNANTHHSHQGTTVAPPTQAPSHPAPPHQAPAPPHQAPPHQAPSHQAPPHQIPPLLPQAPHQAPQVPHQVPRPVQPPPATHAVPQSAPAHQALPPQHHQPPVMHHQPPQPTPQTPATQVAPPAPPPVTHPNPYQQTPAYAPQNPPASYAAPQYSTQQYSTGSVPPRPAPPATQTHPVIPPPMPVPTPASNAGHPPPTQPPYQLPGQFMNRPPPPGLPQAYSRPPPITTQPQQYQQPPPAPAAVPQQPPIYHPPPPPSVRPGVPGMSQAAPSMLPQFPPRQLPPPGQAPPALPSQYQTPTTQYRSHTPVVSQPVAPSQYTFSRSQSSETAPPFPVAPSTATPAAPPPPGMAPNYPPPTSNQPGPGQPDKAMLSIAQEYAAKQLQSLGVPRDVAMQPVTGFVGQQQQQPQQQQQQQQQQGAASHPPGSVGQQQQQSGYSTGLATVRITGRDMMGRRPSHGSGATGGGATYR